MPNEVCIETCDENIFTVIYDNNNKQCGLCRDLNKNNQYKLINTKKCFSTPPEGTKIIDEKLKLINCSDGYILKNDTCIIDKCNKNCRECSDYSEDDNNQKCISCQNKMMFYIMEIVLMIVQMDIIKKTKNVMDMINHALLAVIVQIIVQVV